MPDCLYLFAPLREGAALPHVREPRQRQPLRRPGERGPLRERRHRGRGERSSSAQGDAARRRRRRRARALARRRTPRPGNWLPTRRRAPSSCWSASTSPTGSASARRSSRSSARAAAPAPPPPTGADRGAPRAAREWLTGGGALWDRMSRGLLADAAEHARVPRPRRQRPRAGLRGPGVRDRATSPAPRTRRCSSEFPVPRCRHWSVSLANCWWASLDFATRQTSLNGRPGAARRGRRRSAA